MARTIKRLFPITTDNNNFGTVCRYPFLFCCCCCYLFCECSDSPIKNVFNLNKQVFVKVFIFLNPLMIWSLMQTITCPLSSFPVYWFCIKIMIKYKMKQAICFLSIQMSVSMLHNNILQYDYIQIFLMFHVKPEWVFLTIDLFSVMLRKPAYKK